MITDNQVYTYIAQHLRSVYGEDIHITSERLYMCAEFPTVSIVCIDTTPISETIDCTESNKRMTFEVNVYTDTTMNDAKEIANETYRAFHKCYFRCRLLAPLDNVNDLTIKRYVGSFTRAIGYSDILPNQ